MIAARDAFGFRRVCYARSGRALATSVRSLLAAAPETDRALDHAMLSAHLEGVTLTDRTLFAAVGEVPPEHELRATPQGFSVAARPQGARRGDLLELLRAAVARALSGAKRAAIALSGGLDSAIVMALAGSAVPAYVLAPAMPGYSELDAAERTARAVGARLTVIEAGEADLRAALPDAIAAIEVPLFNAHPVARLLLARAMRRDGIELALGGDGADHVVKRDRSANYLPLVRDLYSSAGVELQSPFLDEAVISHLLSLPVDPEKPALRAVGAALGVPDALVSGPKRGRLAPPIELAGLAAPGRIRGLAERLERPCPSLATDAERMRWTTSVLLLESFGVVT